MGTVIISGNNYTIYGSQAGAIAYLTGSITPQAAKFISPSTTADSQARALVDATRELERQLWIDSVNTFPLRDAIPAFQNASYELAALLLTKPNLFDASGAGSNVQSVTAGPTSVTFFKPTDAGRFPTRVQELIGVYLAGEAPSIPGGSESLGNTECAESQFDDCDRYGLWRGA
jgi:hypothetical protein